MTFKFYQKERVEVSNIINIKDAIFESDIVITIKVLGIIMARYSSKRIVENKEELKEFNNTKLGFGK